MTDRPPNFLLITADQLRADHLGCYGNETISTPHIDALAARGRRFDRAYVASPVCMPNRASLLTGRMPSLHGVRHNGLNLALNSMTLPEALRSAGYRTSLSGKPHFQCVTDAKPPMQAAGRNECQEAEARQAPEGRYNQERGPLWRDNPEHRLDLPYYGFDHVDLAVGHGDAVDGHYNRWVADKGHDLDALRGPKNALSSKSSDALQAWQTAVPEDAYPTRFVEEKTIESLLHSAEAPGRPFFHWASFCDPHHPFTPPGRYWDMYSPDEVTLPTSFNSGHQSDQIAEIHQARRDGTANLNGTGAVSVSESEARLVTALTYGMITMIDDAIGNIISTLESSGLAENTFVIFLSDHGDLMGEHGLVFKGPYHYDGVIRTPLIWSTPTGRSNMPAGSCDDLISAVDVPATIFAASGIAPYNGLSGRPFFSETGKSLKQRDCVLIEDEIQSNLPGTSVRGRVRTLITDEWRLTIYDGIDGGELFNLRTDPSEINNLWDDLGAAEIRASLTERLLREMIANSETSPLPQFAA